MQRHGRSTRKRNAILFFTYGLMTLAVAGISAVCIMLVLGYRFDFKSGGVEQGALMQFRSFPTNATITLDEKPLAFRTPGKENVEVGSHSVTMNLKGYHEWRKELTIKPQELRWVNYARLVPKDIKTETVKEFPTIAGVLPAPNHKWIAMLTSPEVPELTLVDIRDKEKPVFTQLRLPEGSYTQVEGEPHAFELVEWDFGARFVLVRHTVGAVSEYIRLDRTDSDKTVNISTKLGVNPEDIHFSGTSGNVFYALESGLIRRLDSGAGTISQPVVKNVASFKLYSSSTLAYVKQPVEQRVEVGVVVGDKVSRVATYDDTLPVQVDISEYFSDYYLMIARGSSVIIMKNPDQKNATRFASIKTVSTVDWAKLSNGGRFAVAGTGSQFTTFDIETREKHDVNLPGTPLNATKPLQWLDDYHLISTADNNIRMTEFDGANQHVLGSTVSGFAVTLDDRGEVLYSVDKTQNGAYALRAARMVIKN